MTGRWMALIAMALSLALLPACPGPEKPPPAGPVFPVAPADYPRFADDLPPDSLMEAVSQSLTYLSRLPSDRAFSIAGDAYTAGQMLRGLNGFLSFLKTRPGPAALDGYIRKHFAVYRSAGRETTGRLLFTGYFEPMLAGRLAPEGPFRHPVYGTPEDLAVVDLGEFSEKLAGQKIIGRVSGRTFAPYHDRAAIEGEGVLEGKAPALAWVADNVGLFFLHIQGSGKIALPDGRTLNVHYDAKNGRPYRSIGQVLIDEGRVPLSEMSMQAIKAHLAAHPEEVDRILNANPSYIFFSLTADGPYGAMNVRLTPERSIAIDRSLFPLSALAFIRASKPVTNGAGGIEKWIEFERLVLTQDTGGAIKGPGRADLFWGAGPYAEIGAGHMRHPGDLFILMPLSGS